MPSPYLRSIWYVESLELVLLLLCCYICSSTVKLSIGVSPLGQPFLIPLTLLCLLFAALNFTIHMTLGLLDSNGAFNGNYFGAEDEAEDISILVNDTQSAHLCCLRNTNQEI